MKHHKPQTYGGTYGYYYLEDLERHYAMYGVVYGNPLKYFVHHMGHFGDGKKYLVYEPQDFHRIVPGEVYGQIPVWDLTVEPFKGDGNHYTFPYVSGNLHCCNACGGSFCTVGDDGYYVGMHIHGCPVTEDDLRKAFPLLRFQPVKEQPADTVMIPMGLR